MGNKTINGIKTRLDSALNELRDCMNKINATTEQYKPVVKSEFSQTTNQMQWFISNIPEIEPEIEVNVGGILNKLRSAIDQAVYAMAIIGNKGVEPIDKHNVCFPIYTDECDFENKISKGKAFKKNFDNAVISMMRDLQPFHGYKGLCPIDHPLQALKFLSNHDKHRQSLSLNIRPVGFDWDLKTVNGRTARINPKDSLHIEPEPYENGQIFARLDWPDGWSPTFNTLQFYLDYIFETTPRYPISHLGSIYLYVEIEVFEKRFMPYLERNQHRLK